MLSSVDKLGFNQSTSRQVEDFRERSDGRHLTVPASQGPLKGPSDGPQRHLGSTGTGRAQAGTTQRNGVVAYEPRRRSQPSAARGAEPYSQLPPRQIASLSPPSFQPNITHISPGKVSGLVPGFCHWQVMRTRSPFLSS